MQKEIRWLLEEKYSGKAGKKFNKDVERLKMGEPLDYVIGFCEFLGCKIDLSKKPLIPRPETEYWVQQGIKEIYRDFNDRKNQSINVLDIFSGSGCIGVSIMRNVINSQREFKRFRNVKFQKNLYVATFKDIHVTFVEKDKNFIKQIKINCKLNNIVKDAHRIIQSDVFLNVKGKYDYIFANPPYIAKNRISKIQKSVLKYEPKMALFGGNDGLLYIRKFLAEAKNFLNPDGKIYMEFDSIQKKEIEKLLKKFRYKKWEFHKDQYNKFRYVIICKAYFRRHLAMKIRKSSLPSLARK